MQALSKLRTHYLAMAAAGALGLFLAASPPAAAQGDDEYVDDPAYAEQSNDAPMSDEAPADDMDDTAMDGEAMDQTAAANGDGQQVAAAEEEVIVTAPSVRIQREPTLRPGKMLDSRAVSFADLDLRTREGARELRARVREAASEICDGLSVEYPADPGDYRACYKEAVSNGLVRANAAIDDARSYAYRP